MKNKLEPGIYCITNKVNGKVYVGQAQYVARRIYEHKYHMERGTDKCTALQRAVNKYGLDNFEFEVLEMCPVDLLNEREISWISVLQSNKPTTGYNILSGGNDGGRGRKYPKEFGERISEMKKGKSITDDHKRKISEAQKGVPKPAGMREKLSAAISGNRHWHWGGSASESTKKKMSLSHSGTNNVGFGMKRPDSSSEYYGVYKEVRTKKSGKAYTYWIAHVSVGVQKKVIVCRSKEEVDAARAYDAYVREHNLPHPLNFPEEFQVIESILDGKLSDPFYDPYAYED